MRQVICDICKKREQLKLDGSSSMQRLFFDDICYECYEKIREDYIKEGGDKNE